MRTFAAILAAGLAGFGGAYMLNKYSDKLPAFMKEASIGSAVAVATIVAIPSLVAYTLVGGVSHGTLPIPTTK